jgi:hypothetical protein
MNIINPFEEKILKDAKDALIMDEKNLARALFIQHSEYTATRAFDEAACFIAEQTRRFPLNNTVDGRSKE